MEKLHKKTCKTALPTAHATAFPPNVLKWLAPSKLLAISGVVTTAANGKPLPIPKNKLHLN